MDKNVVVRKFRITTPHGAIENGESQSAPQNATSVFGDPAEQDRWWESREKGRNEHKKDDKENI